MSDYCKEKDGAKVYLEKEREGRKENGWKKREEGLDITKLNSTSSGP